MLGRVVVGAAKIAATGIIADEIRKRAAPKVEKGVAWLEAKVTEGISDGKEFLTERKRISALQREAIQTISTKFDQHQEYVSNMHPRWREAEQGEFMAALHVVVLEAEETHLGKFAVSLHKRVSDFRQTIKKLIESEDEKDIEKDTSLETNYQRAARSNASKARSVVLDAITKIPSSPARILVALSLRDRLLM